MIVSPLSGPCTCTVDGVGCPVADPFSPDYVARCLRASERARDGAVRSTPLLECNFARPKRFVAASQSPRSPDRLLSLEIFWRRCGTLERGRCKGGRGRGRGGEAALLLRGICSTRVFIFIFPSVE